MQRGGKVAIALDADKPDELMAWLAQQLPAAERLLPRAGKDWNEQLTGTGQTILRRPQIATLWKWHQAAVAAGHSEKHLCRIRDVVVAFY